MTRNIIIYSFLASVFSFSFFISIVSAQSRISGMVDDAAKEANYQQNVNNTTLPKTVGKFINTFLSFLGVIFISLAVYAGYLWMTARDEEQKVNEAKEILQNAVIGIIIVVSAYAITYFVIYYLASPYVKDGKF